jgi:hypothetical protein
MIVLYIVVECYLKQMAWCEEYTVGYMRSAEEIQSVPQIRTRAICIVLFSVSNSARQNERLIRGSSSQVHDHKIIGYVFYWFSIISYH